MEPWGVTQSKRRREEGEPVKDAKNGEPVKDAKDGQPGG